VKATYPGAYYKHINKWFDGYQGQETVVIEDVDPDSCTHMTRYFKIWGDRYAFPVEIKGGSLIIRPKMVIITSNYTMEECFKNLPDLEAMQRRYLDKPMSFS